MGSYLNVKRAGGLWLVRMEDVDTPRSVKGADGAILRALERYGLAWDGEVLYQSRRIEAYREALAVLQSQGLLYACDCSRRILAEQGLLSAPYPGLCRHRRIDKNKPHAIRLRVEERVVTFNDGVYGPVGQNLKESAGDFVLLRADGIFAYQLAVVVDDAWQGVSEVVRGGDLLESTPRQIYLQGLLGYPLPRYAHLPLALGPDGQKLSKQNLAKALDEKNPSDPLWRSLGFLGLNPPEALRYAPPQEQLEWALAHWTLECVPARDAFVVNP